MNIFWTKESPRSLQEIEDFISLNNPDAAIKTVDKLISLTEILIKFPEKGRVVPELSVG